MLFKKWYLVEVLKFQLPTKQDLLYCRRIVFKISDEHPVHFKRGNTLLPLPRGQELRQSLVSAVIRAIPVIAYYMTPLFFKKNILSENVICGRL